MPYMVVKGFPWWPARVQEVSGQTITVFFFGTEQLGKVRAGQSSCVPFSARPVGAVVAAGKRGISGHDSFVEAVAQAQAYDVRAGLGLTRGGSGHVEVVEELIRRGANHKESNIAGVSPFRVASDRGSHAVVKYLFSVPSVKKSLRRRICFYCGHHTDLCKETFKVCARCRGPRYCSRACQVAHWTAASRGMDEVRLRREDTLFSKSQRWDLSVWAEVSGQQGDGPRCPFVDPGPVRASTVESGLGHLWSQARVIRLEQRLPYGDFGYRILFS